MSVTSISAVVGGSMGAAAPRRIGRQGQGQLPRVILGRGGRRLRGLAMLAILVLSLQLVVQLVANAVTTDAAGGSAGLTAVDSSDAASVVSGGGLGQRVHRVEVGDSIWSIAVALPTENDPRQTVDEIQALNGLASSELQVGQVLLLPPVE